MAEDDHILGRRQPLLHLVRQERDAAEKTGRRGYGIEIDPAYCDVTIRRLRAVCGLEAVLEGTGQRFAEVEAERLGGEVR